MQFYILGVPHASYVSSVLVEEVEGGAIMKDANLRYINGEKVFSIGFEVHEDEGVRVC